MIKENKEIKELLSKLPRNNYRVKKSIEVASPCIVLKKLHDITFPRAVYHKKRWLSFSNITIDMCTKLGLVVKDVNFRLFTKEGLSHARNIKMAMKLASYTDGYITTNDVMFSLKLALFINGDITLNKEEKEEIRGLYAKNGLYIDGLLKNKKEV